jgi:hypothetical protein
MFNSGQFEGALVNFQQLLSEGMFDSLEPGMDAGVLEHLQQVLTASDLNSSGCTGVDPLISPRYIL